MKVWLLVGWGCWATVPGMFEEEACECLIPGAPEPDPDKPPDTELCYIPICERGSTLFHSSSIF